jgi:hypothetical protein
MAIPEFMIVPPEVVAFLLEDEIFGRDNVKMSFLNDSS